MTYASTASAASAAFLVATAIPAAAYFGFLIVHLPLDLMSAVLAMPERLAGLSGEKQGAEKQGEAKK